MLSAALATASTAEVDLGISAVVEGEQEGKVDDVNAGVFAKVRKTDLARFCGTAPVDNNVTLGLSIKISIRDLFNIVSFATKLQTRNEAC